MTFEAGYLIIDIQNIYNKAQAELPPRTLSDTEKIGLTKFLIKNAISRMRPQQVVLSNSSNTYEFNYEEPFVINASTYLYPYTQGLILRDAVNKFNRAFGPNKTEFTNSLFSKIFYPSNTQTNGYGRSVGIGVITPEVMGRVVVYRKNQPNLQTTHDLLPVLNQHYRDRSQVNNVLFAQWSA